ncbi:MAG: hypothetical protein BMS9Abin08_1618 [Gammaproteobacteria bacterium]|nr:MAG: hypothetical protein BMS9Abin08_1618 [Gammaproteobacteria bacterium]
MVGVAHPTWLDAGFHRHDAIQAAQGIERISRLITILLPSELAIRVK